MPLAPGHQLGPYEILAKLGEGGMGEVYKARDNKLNREVAIKVLPQSLSNDPDYLARFQREAQSLAALHHPHIATIFGLEQNAIVMELIDGRPLHGPLPIETVVPIAKQIAEALEAAHDKGIIHRDLKPANILLTPDSQVKILDFGLAKAVETTTQSDRTLTLQSTQAGLILGTAAYMSPEQAAGKPADRRADIWSFGVVLYELITGQQLFAGETVSHILAEVLKTEIEFAKIPAGPLRQLLQRCLDRNLKTRLQHIGEARIALKTQASPPSHPHPQNGLGSSPPPPSPSPPSPSSAAPLRPRSPSNSKSLPRRVTGSTPTPTTTAPSSLPMANCWLSLSLTLMGSAISTSVPSNRSKPANSRGPRTPPAPSGHPTASPWPSSPRES